MQMIGPMTLRKPSEGTRKRKSDQPTDSADWRLDQGLERLLSGFDEMERSLREREARERRHINQATGIVLLGIALMVAIILQFG